MTYLRADQEIPLALFGDFKSSRTLPVSCDKDTALLYRLPQGNLAPPAAGRGDVAAVRDISAEGGPCCHPPLRPPDALQVGGTQHDPSPARGQILPTEPAGAQAAQPAPIAR